ncbi:MAG: ABC transporter permease [Pseudobdellovibrio sp.]
MLKKLIPGLISFAVIIFLWELSAHFNWINIFILPAPSRVAVTFYEVLLNGELLTDIAISFIRVGLGFFLAAVLALPFGFLMAFNSRFSAFCLPVFNFFRPIPPIAWMPLAILWFGIGHAPAVFLTMLAAFFTILFGTLFGVDSISPDHLRVARCFQASKWLTFTDVIFPAAFPSVFNGLRIGFGLSWMAVVGAEMIASTSGLGHLISTSQDTLRADLVIIGMFSIGLTAFVCDWIFRKVGLLFMPWKDPHA